MAVDCHDFDKGLFSALDVAAVRAFIGNPVRIFNRVTRNATFPFVRVDDIAIGPLFGVLGTTSGGTWVRQMKKQFNVFALETKHETVCNIQEAMQNILDVPSNISVTAGAVTMSMPGTDFRVFNDNTSIAIFEYTFSIEDTA